MRNGLDGFQDYEVIELLLTLGIPRKDCKPQAKIALKKFKTLKGVLEAPVEELIQIEGLAERGIIALKIIREVAERMIQDRVTASGVCCNSAQDVYDYLKISISAQPKELFKVLYLDNRNRFIKV
jgi:DNA repair protein RadC